MIVTVPDEDLYEQGQFPSTFNLDHKWTFTIYKPASWSPKSVNVLSLLTGLGPAAQLVKVELLDATYRYELPRYDQTVTPIGECGIEFVIRRRPESELATLGRHPQADNVPEELRVHLNQYRDDIKTLKTSNAVTRPFKNTQPI